MIFILLNQEVNAVWHHMNKEHYESLGYTFTNYKEQFKVKVADLGIHSPIQIDVLCDYCLDAAINNIVQKDYCNYLKERRFVEKDTCNICKYKKYKDVLIYKQRQGLLTLKIKDIGNLKRIG